MQPPEEITRALRECDLFTSLPEVEREALARRTETRELDRREILFHRGDSADRTYLLLEGQMKLTQMNPAGSEVIVVLLGPGDPFAVISAMQETSFPVTAEAMTPSRLLSWRRDVLAEVMRRFPTVSVDATRLVSTRMRGLQERFRELATQSVPGRLARELLRLGDDHGTQSSSGLGIDLVLSREDLAQLTGTTLYTVSRILNTWRRDGLVEVGRQRVVIRDPSRLADLASAE